MFCKKCGKEIADDSDFCRYCGADLREDKVSKTEEKSNVEETLEKEVISNITEEETSTEVEETSTEVVNNEVDKTSSSDTLSVGKKKNNKYLKYGLIAVGLVLIFAIIEVLTVKNNSYRRDFDLSLFDEFSYDLSLKETIEYMNRVNTVSLYEDYSSTDQSNNYGLRLVYDDITFLDNKAKLEIEYNMSEEDIAEFSWIKDGYGGVDFVGVLKGSTFYKENVKELLSKDSTFARINIIIPKSPNGSKKYYEAYDTIMSEFDKKYGERSDVEDQFSMWWVDTPKDKTLLFLSEYEEFHEDSEFLGDSIITITFS